MTDPSSSFDFASLRALFEPRGVAVIGASSDPTRIGGRPIQGSKAWGYAQGLYPVNPGHATIQGLPSFRTVGAIGKPVDLAVIALPAAKAADALRDCADSGVRAAVILSAGFAELGRAGAALQQQLVDIARGAGIRIVGPNCMGYLNPRAGLVASFTSLIDQHPVREAGISLVSQSGAFGSHCLAILRERGLPLEMWATTGNQCDVDVADCLAYMAQAPSTRVIAACVEGIPHGGKFIAALELARRRRIPVVMMKLGHSAVGREAAATHTAALAGSDAVFDAVLTACDAHRARDVDELFDVAYACMAGKFPASAAVGLITTSGGFGIVMADAAADHGLAVPALPQATQDRLKKLVPFAATRNPLDVTGQFINDPSAVLPMFEALINDGGSPATICYIGSAGVIPDLMDKLAPSFEAVAARFRDNLLVLSMICNAPTRQRFEELGFLVYENPSRAVAAVAALHRFGAAFARAPALDGGAVGHSVDAPVSDHAMLDESRLILDESRSKRLLVQAGIPVPGERIVTAVHEVAAACAALGFPLVMKILSPDIVHKSDIGGVVLGIDDVGAAEAAYIRITDAVSAAAPCARREGVLIAPFITDGVEMIVGVQNDPTFGPVILLGCGGLFVETMAATTLRLAPFGVETAHAMIAATPGAALLAGARGRPVADIDALAQTLACLSAFASANAAWLDSVDVNPLIVRPRGKGVAALDAVVTLRDNPDLAQARAAEALA